MNKMYRITLALLIILCSTSTINAQLFESQIIYPNIKIVKSKYYNGAGGWGYWSINKLDSIGRTIEKENYQKNKLLSKEKISYNDHNDILYKIQVFDANNPQYRNDTIIRYEYRYSNGRILYQKSNYGYSKHDSSVVCLVESKGDTTLIYQSKSFYYRARTNAHDIYEKRYTLHYKNELLVCFEVFDFFANTKETNWFEYYPNGKLKRKRIEREPESKPKGAYSGGVGNDDMFYKYKFDKFGRIKVLYYVIENKKYKIAICQYKE